MEEMNMQIWDLVCQTDPSWTKAVSLGGRKFTAIDAQKQIKLATQMWGPYGFRWGVRSCEYHYVFGGDDVGGAPISIALEAVFFYPVEHDVVGPCNPGEPGQLVRMISEVEFQISTDMPWKLGGDCRKKLLTDLTTKALSKLGFNSDVFEGQFDDNRYVSEMRRKFAKESHQEAPKTAPKSNPAPDTPGDTDADTEAPAAPRDPLEEAIEAMWEHPNWNWDTYYKVLGSAGYESHREIKGETDRRKFAAAVRREMDIPR